MEDILVRVSSITQAVDEGIKAEIAARTALAMTTEETML
jgi:hypothetical protein